MLTHSYPKVSLCHTPTPLEALPNLSATLGGATVFVKRDDCTGLAMGGNKARQLEYYIGDAVSKGADTLITTGAVQSNHVRMTVAAARKLGLDVEVQLEQRVQNQTAIYHESGNPLLGKLMGATIHYFQQGEDEAGADQALYQRAQILSKMGKTPHVIPLSANHPPFGALGYVECAEELLQQIEQQSFNISAIVTGSGSASTHAGLLAGFKALGSDIQVYGICVRRNQAAQHKRVLHKTTQVAEMIGYRGAITHNDVKVDDSVLAPGYGKLNAKTHEAIQLCAVQEGLLLDPVYTGKTMAGLINLMRLGEWTEEQQIIFLHTGGTPALFAYPELSEIK